MTRGLLIAFAAVFVSVLGAFAQESSDITRHVVDRLKENVFQIAAMDSAGAIAGTGTGFFIDASGLAITNHHVIRDAIAARAIRHHDRKQFPVELLATDPLHDQSLVRVGIDGTDWNPSGLNVGAELPYEGLEVWAVGYPKSLGFTLTKGIVSGVRKWAELPPTLQRQLGPDTTWIQIDASLNKGNSGGPLVAADGTVYGVNTWKLVDGESLNFASSALHIAEVRTLSTGAPLAFPGLSPSPDPVPVRSEPELSGHLEPSPPKGKLTADLLKRAQLVQSSVRCQGCSGVGTISVKKRTGSRVAGGLVHPVYSRSERRCDDCGGSGKEPSSRTYRALENLARDSARVGRADDTDGSRVRIIADVLRDALKGHEGALGFDGHCPTIFIANTPGNAPVWFRARVVVELRTGGEDADGPLYLLKTLDERASVVVEASLLCDQLSEGTDVAVFGLYQGRGDLSDGTSIRVIRGALVMRYP